MNPGFIREITESIGESNAKLFPLTGGDINEAFRLEGQSGRSYFLKVNRNDLPGIFEKEKAGLDELRKCPSLKTPDVISLGKTSIDIPFLILEYLDFSYKSEEYWGRFGEGLSKLHQIKDSSFGFKEDNFIGSLPQLNHRYSNANDFVISGRFEPMLKLAVDKGLFREEYQEDFKVFCHNIQDYFKEEMPSLIHGDLWSGNHACVGNDEPCIFDPAVCYGLPGFDFAMLRLFGKPPAQFYEGYFGSTAKVKELENAWEILSLYYLLVHLVLFGRSYLAPVVGILKKYR